MNQPVLHENLPIIEVANQLICKRQR